MKMIVVNKRPEQCSFEVPLADGTVIQRLLPRGATLETAKTDSYDSSTHGDDA